MSDDNELVLMKRFYTQLKVLPRDAQVRVLEWLRSKIYCNESQRAIVKHKQTEGMGESTAQMTNTMFPGLIVTGTRLHDPLQYVENNVDD